MLLNKTKGFIYLLPRKARVLGKLSRGFEPKLGFTILPLNMHVHSRLFPREEVEPETAFTKNGWTHGQ